MTLISKDFIFIAMTFFFAGEVYSSEVNCFEGNVPAILDSQKLTPLLKVTDQSPAQKYIQIKSSFEKGTLPGLDQFEANYNDMFKVVWRGSCLSEGNEERPSEIRATRYINKAGKISHKAGILPEYDERKDSNNIFNLYNTYSPPSRINEPLVSGSSVVLHSTGAQEIADVFSGKVSKFTAEIREQKLENGKTILFAKLNKVFKSKSDTETLKGAQSESAIGYCKFDKQYQNKITKLENTPGCFQSYEQMRTKYSKGKKWSRIATAMMLPYNFVVAGGALILSNSKKANYEQELSIMMTLFEELKTPDVDGKTPVLDKLYEKIIAEQPNYGNKEKLVNLLRVANESFYFCYPNIENGFAFTLNDIASEILGGRLSQETFGN